MGVLSQTWLQKKGFVTIATGQEWYYKLAVNLLHSYRRNTTHPFPFAIIATERTNILPNLIK